MIVMLVHWLIKKGSEKAFAAHWRTMTVNAKVGLYREFLTSVDDDVADPMFHTFSALSNPHYTTFINVGLWESVEAFDAAIKQYIPPATEGVGRDGRVKTTVELERFEFKLRERVVLQVIADRDGGDALPPASSATASSPISGDGEW